MKLVFSIKGNSFFVSKRNGYSALSKVVKLSPDAFAFLAESKGVKH